MSRSSARFVHVAALAFALVLPLGAAGARQICETPPGALACLPFPCLAIEAQTLPGFGCSIPIPPCGVRVPPMVATQEDAGADVLCDCPSPCIIVDCLPPIEGRMSWRGCPIEWEVP